MTVVALQRTSTVGNLAKEERYLYYIRSLVNTKLDILVVWRDGLVFWTSMDTLARGRT